MQRREMDSINYPQPRTITILLTIQCMRTVGLPSEKKETETQNRSRNDKMQLHGLLLSSILFFTIGLRKVLLGEKGLWPFSRMDLLPLMLEKQCMYLRVEGWKGVVGLSQTVQQTRVST